MAREISESFTLDEGVDQYGIRTKYHFNSDSIISQRTYDAEPILRAAAAERAATAGERWGEMRKVGSIPMAVYADALKIQDVKERQKFVLGWLKQNPAMVTFDRFLK